MALESLAAACGSGLVTVCLRSESAAVCATLAGVSAGERRFSTRVKPLNLWFISSLVAVRTRMAVSRNALCVREGRANGIDLSMFRKQVSMLHNRVMQQK